MANLAVIMYIISTAHRAALTVFPGGAVASVVLAKLGLVVLRGLAEQLERLGLADALAAFGGRTSAVSDKAGRDGERQRCTTRKKLRV